MFAHAVYVVFSQGILTTASSNILSNYVPVYDATVYKKLKEKKNATVWNEQHWSSWICQGTW